MPFAAPFATAFASRPEGIGEILVLMTNQLREERAIEAWEGHTPPSEACSVCLNGFLQTCRASAPWSQTLQSSDHLPKCMTR